MSESLLLAQATPNPDAGIAWNVVLTIGVLFAIGANVITMLRMNGSQKRDVTIRSGEVSAVEFGKLEEENSRAHENLFSKIGGVERGARTELREEVALLRADITKAHTDLSVQMTRTFQDMERAIGRVEGRLSE